jgi:uracil-DNA glycosylase
MLKDLIGESWYNVLNDEEKECFLEKYLIIEEKRKTQEILPYEAENSGIYYALKITPFDKVKVLIMGQDPYPNKEDSHGLAF